MQALTGFFYAKHCCAGARKARIWNRNGLQPQTLLSNDISVALRLEKNAGAAHTKAIEILATFLFHLADGDADYLVLFFLR